MVESGVIIFSVLVAFAVDAWWEQYKERRSADGHVAAILGELDAASQRLDRSARLAGVAEDAARAWLADAGRLPPDSLNALLGGMVMWATADLTVPSIHALLDSGQAETLGDSDLRKWIEAFPTEVRDFEEEEVGSIGFLDSAFVPYLASRGVSLGNSDPLGMGLRGRAPEELASKLADDWGFEALVVWRAAKARDVIESAEKLRVVIDEGRRAIRERN